MDGLGQTLVSGVVAALVPTISGYLIWRFNRRQDEQSADAAKYAADTQARRDMYEAWDHLSDRYKERIDQLIKEAADARKEVVEARQEQNRLWEDRRALWQQIMDEKEHSRQQDAALAECEKTSSSLREIVANLTRRIQDLEKPPDA